MRIQIISKDNGVGLSHDVRVLREAIAMAAPDAEVMFIDWQDTASPRPSDVNIFLELLAGHIIGTAPRNIYVPNPEWYYSHLWGASIPKLSEIWAKTRDCQAIFARLHPRVVYSGWTSEDIFEPSVQRDLAMLHVAGASSAKGTRAVLQAAQEATSSPLTVISRMPIHGAPQLRHIRYVVNPTDQERIRLQNSHVFHLCPSSYEGFGHYINEGRACGAVVITTNAPPMNELVREGFGIGIPCTSYTVQNLARHCHVDHRQLAIVMQRMSLVGHYASASIGTRARMAYEAERAAFHEFIKTQLS